MSSLLLKKSKEGDTLWVEEVTSDVKRERRGRGKHKRKRTKH